MDNIQLIVEINNVGERLDKFISDKLTDFTRTYAQKLILEECITVNGNITKANYKAKLDDVVTIVTPPLKELELKPQNIEIEVVYEDEHLMIVNKPQGMVVHPAAGNEDGTLVNALLYHCGNNLSGINGVLRPGIVHRIDKDTSGLLMVAKSNLAHLGLSQQIKDHTLTREYIALVHGKVKADSGTINAPIARSQNDRKKMAVTSQGGRDAVTHYFVIEHYVGFTLVRCRLETGRTHQIRVHMSYIGHPVVGDKAYGIRHEKFKLKGQLLHAAKLGFIHPANGEYMEFTADLPTYYEDVLNGLRNTAL